MTNREKFIVECSMRNLQSCFGHYRDVDCNTEDTVTNCYEAAIKLAKLLENNIWDSYEF